MEEVQSIQVARLILAGFAEYRDRFEQISAGARRRFEQADWHGMQQACQERIELYDLMVSHTVAQVLRQAGPQLAIDTFWPDAKQAYSRLVLQRHDPELAETFFNSIYCRTFKHQGIDERKVFVHSAIPDSWRPPEIDILRHYDLGNGLVRTVNAILTDFAFEVPYENKRRDLRNIVRYLCTHRFGAMPMDSGARVEIIGSPFFRNKAAYLVGRAVQGAHQVPFVLAILNNEQGGVYVDTLIDDPDDVSIIFSFTRSYFMVAAPVPCKIVELLHGLLPAKQLYEVYSSLGFYKHGKTVFYRDFLEHMARTDDQFVIAPGVKGMVMSVFTLPSLNVVFKIIKDRFAAPKEMTRETVKQKYRLVKRHDKAGRMADTQEFSYFTFDRARFSNELLDELQAVAGSSLQLTGNKVVIRHLWTERRMIPLNLYLETCTEEEARSAISEYGNAIRQLAAANIFPGDMLFKNFGVTRHGRVVFYDYDEICYLTECNFRRIPPPRYPEDELSGEPWYSVGPNDVFPEEFRIFLTGRAEVRRIFNELHSEIFDAAYWQGLQGAIRAGEVVDVFPYRRKKRFTRTALSKGFG